MNDNAQAMPLQIIKASAGSGKTFQLAYEYIKLLLGVKNADGTYSLGNRTEYHQHILAVTFTNKATGEMKSRIVNELWLLSQGKGDYAKLLTAELHTTPALLKKASRKALEEILFNYTTFNVSTIDSFFQTVLRTFAFELDQDYDYAVELDQKYSQAIAVQNMLLNVGSSSDSNDRVAQWLREYMLQKFYDSNLKSSSWNVFKSSGLGDMAANLSKEWFVKHRAEVEAYLQDVFEQQDASEKPQSQREPRIEQFKSQLKKMSADADKRIGEFAKRFAEILNSVGLKVDGLSKVSGLACLKNPLINKDKADIGKIDDFIAKDVDVSKWSTDKNWKKVAKTGEYDGAVAKMKKLANDAIPVLRNKSLLKDMTNNLYLFGLLGVIGNEMEKFLRDNDTVLLSDTNQLLERVMISSNVMFVYERMGTWINHYLIDEFQDTSALQYRNLKPLLEESVAFGSENLVIGDEKQCIYRFRDSDPELLQRTIIKDFQNSVHVDNTKVVNWRSTPNIIRFNNSFFWNLVRMTEVGGVYDNVLQDVNSKQHCNDGAVKITFFAPENGKKFSDQVLERLPDYINEIRSRGYRLRDIAILVRKNKEGANIIDKLLAYNKTADEAHRIEVMSAESMFLSKSPAVRSVISYLRYFDSLNYTESNNEKLMALREREERIKRVLRDFDSRVSSHCTDVADPESEEHGMEIGELLKKAFENDLQRQETRAGENEPAAQPRYSREYLTMRDELMKGSADSFDLVSIVENIICQVVDDDTRENEKAFLMALMDCVIDYSASGNATVHSFLKWWDNKQNLAVSSPEGRDAVNIVTIHKSKGLEYPCVIIPFADWEMCKLDPQMWLERKVVKSLPMFVGVDEEIIPPLLPIKSSLVKDFEEFQDIYKAELSESYVDNVNGTYVAFTRAVNELHMFAPDCVPEIGDIDGVRLNNELKAVCEALSDENACEINAAFAGKTGKASQVAIGIDKQENDVEIVYNVGNLEQIFTPKAESEVNATANDIMPQEVPEYDSALREVDVCVPETYSEIQERGIRLHKLFSMLKRERNRDSVLKRARRRGIIADCYDEAVALVDKALSNERTAEWFANDNVVFNEREIVDADGSSKRPDRIIRTPQGKVIVVDYKFGNDHSHDNRYISQVQGYISQLGKAGMTVDEAYVWYPVSGNIIKVK